MGLELLSQLMHGIDSTDYANKVKGPSLVRPAIINRLTVLLIIILVITVSRVTFTNTSIAASKVNCVIGGNCPIGSTGPGGGIVFYDAGTQQSWGRYLEMAPSGWAGSVRDPYSGTGRRASSAHDPYLMFCDITGVYFYAGVTNKKYKAQLGIKLGLGKANTNLLLKSCNESAGIMANEYMGGGMKDWYLPSKDELNELCKYARNQTTGNTKVLCSKKKSLREGFEDNAYWSSSEKNAQDGWFQNLYSGEQDTFRKLYTYYIRPVRAI